MLVLYVLFNINKPKFSNLSRSFQVWNIFKPGANDVISPVKGKYFLF